MKSRLILVCAALLCGAAPRPIPHGLPDGTVPLGLGVNIHFVEPRTRDLDMIAAAGFRFVRMDLAWSGIERQPGEYDFTGYDHLLDALDARGIRALFILDYGNQLYGAELFRVADDKARQAFARFAAAAAAHFKGRGVIWELWNEPNIKQFWRPEPSADEYMALAKVALPAVRNADPRATIIGPASSTIDLHYLEACFSLGLLDMVDAVSVHPYRGNSRPETVAAEYAKLRASIIRHAPKDKVRLPIISGEWGYTTTDIPADRQGQFLAREFLTNLINDIPISIWYDWHDDGQDPKEREHNFGIVTWDYTAKPAYDAARTLTTELAGFRFVRRVAVESEDDFIAVFAKGKEQKLVAWTTREPHRVVLDPKHKLELDLTNEPLYRKLNSPLPKETGARSATPLRLRLLPREEFPQLEIENTGTQDFRGTARIDLSPVTVGEQVIISALTLPVKLKGGAIGCFPDSKPIDEFEWRRHEDLTVTITTGSDGRIVSVKARQTFDALDWFDPPMAYETFLEGNNRVEADAKLSIGDAPPTTSPFKHAARLDYKFGAGWRFLRVAPKTKLPIEAQPKQVGLWLFNSTSSRDIVRCRFTDASGQTFQPTLAESLTWTGWRWVTMPLNDPNVGHWGGPNDGVIHYPIHWDSILVIDSSRAPHQGTIYFTGLTSLR